MNPITLKAIQDSYKLIQESHDLLLVAKKILCEAQYDEDITIADKNILQEQINSMKATVKLQMAILCPDPKSSYAMMIWNLNKEKP